ncbi:P-type conjugative transfer protein TrbL [Pseudomonas turukhanskensis]|uniref:P-type conjugative transfer protein TrbL n=1 Tax=Pseudomonas turukhanskensis TaxID=1806536 RepID=A0A9W6KBG2_9PSED|nr:P-type conjugative transfer protein TrbL [Pseudomonas turukhanskensis]GLK90934.1 P-type conjugative transfer protein TrbL [Pseudomonas turukhanskensis]
MKIIKSTLLVGLLFSLYSAGASAELAFHDPATQMGVLDQVVQEFVSRAAAWQGVIMAAATWLFWTLGTISFTWTMGMLALRKADIGDFFSEFIRFTLFFGFFYWLLQNGPYFAETIINSLRQIGDNAAGTAGLSPSGVVDIGFMIWKQAISNLSGWSPVDSLVGLVLSAGIMLALATIAVNMLLLLISGWILMYAGIFFLGFGGSRWTSDMAINYFKTVLGLAVQLLVMILLVGVGNNLLTSFYAKMNKATLNFEELGVMLVFCLALLTLTGQVPKMVAGIISGGGGGGGAGGFGTGAIAGAALGAAGTAAGAASMAGSAVMSGAQNISGGASALKAAIQKAQASADGGSDMPSLGAGSSGCSGSSTESPLQAAMGFDSSSEPGGMMQKAASLAAGTASELAKGAGSLIKEKASEAVSNFQEKASQTFGGQLASSIQGEPSFDGDSLSAAGQDDSDMNDEIAQFVNRDRGSAT